MRRATIAILLLAGTVAISAVAAGVEPGNYTVLDGSFAGQDVYVAKSGKISILDGKTDATVAPADDNCDGPHLVGTIDGKSAPLGGCGFGHVALLTKVPAYVRQLANAITEEERALRSLDESPPVKVHWELALYGQLGIEHALDAVDEAEKQGDLSEGAATKIRRRLNPAHTIDEKVKKEQQADATATAAKRQAWGRQLRNALSLKREAFATMVDGLDLGPKCTAEKEFEVFAIPAGYTGSYNDVFPHGIPKGAKVKVSFVDKATGKAPPAEIFPGQTWSVEIRGLQPDGKFDVRVNVAGKGFGKPDANSRSWKVIVSFDCP